MADFYDDPGGLVIQVARPIVSGSGIYNTFLAVQSPGAETTEQGFNLDQNGGFLDAGNGVNTHSLLFSDLFSDDSGDYFVFRLDINEPNEAAGEVTLTDLSFWTGDAATQANWDDLSGVIGLNFNYALTGPVVLTDHTHGSGTDDYVFFVPKLYFAGVDPASYLTVYAKFTGAYGGFEEFASAPGGDDVVHPVGDFSVGIIKDTLAFGSSVEGKTVLVGTDLTWTYSVTTGGGDPIPRALLTVTDDHNLTITYQSGDDGDDLLELGETWLYTATGVATAGQYDNTGTATVTTEVGQEAVTDFDTSSYFGADPKIAITKVTTGIDSATHTNTGDGINVITGTDVLWTYKVTNAGNEPLSDVKVVDDMGTANTADDVTLTAADPHTGDTDLDGKLDLTETWTFTLGGTAHTGDYSNTATASGSFTDDTLHSKTVSASDDSSYHAAGNFSVDIIKDTLAFSSSVEGKIVLIGTPLTWTYSVTTGGGDPIPRALLTVTDDHINLTPAYQSGDDGDNLLELGETWIYTATGIATAGQYNNVGTATVATEPGQAAVTDFDPSSYFGAYTGIDINKVTTGKDSAGVSHTADGISVVTGSAVTWTYTLTNAGNEELSNVTVVDDMGTLATGDDKTLTWANLFSGDTDGDHKLDTTETWVFKLGGIAQSGNYLNTATASGSFTDDTLHTSTATDTDTSGYTGSFTQSKAGLTIGYWYNHLAVSKNDPTAPYADKFLTYAPNDPNHVGKTGLLLGDVNHNGAVDSGETTLWVPRDALVQLINSSQTATDTRQILMSQALATQLNIDNGTGDPGYQGTAGADLITEAVKWLRGITPYTFAGSTGSVEGAYGAAGNNGILTSGAGASFEYNLTTKSFSGDANLSQSGTQVLTSNLTAWQTATTTYDAFDYDHLPKPAPGDNTTNYWANGEGLKNALQAVNQNHLVVDTSGQVVAWDESASATGPYTELHLNGPDDFWAVLSNEYPTHTTLLKGIWA